MRVTCATTETVVVYYGVAVVLCVYDGKHGRSELSIFHIQYINTDADPKANATAMMFMRYEQQTGGATPSHSVATNSH